MGSLRVLHATVWYPTASQPAWGSFIRAHIRAAAIAGATPSVVHLDGSSIRPHRRLDTEGGFRAPVLHVPHRRGRSGAVGYPSRLWQTAQLLVRAARQHSADVLHAHVLEAAVPALLAARRCGLRLVVTEHFSGYATGELTKFQRSKARLTLPRADAVTAVSASLAADLEAVAGVSAHVIPNVVDIGRFHPGTSADVVAGAILFAGRLVPVKQVDVLLDAVAILRRQDPVWHLQVVGDGPLRSQLEQRADALGIDEAVEFTGQLEPQKLATRLRQTAVVVVPSRWETNSVVALEALCSATPVVSSDVGGLRELVTGDRGIRVPAGDPAALAMALTRLGPCPDRLPPRDVADVRRTHAPEAVGAALMTIYRQLH